MGIVIQLLRRSPSALVFVKLHSNLQTQLNPTELQLVGVGVDFVFPLEEGRKEEGRRKEE